MAATQSQAIHQAIKNVISLVFYYVWFELILTRRVHTIKRWS